MEVPADTHMITSLALFLVLAPQSLVPYTFRYEALRDLQTVYVAGTFNNWDKGATPMKADGHTWSATVPLPPGKTLYKFVLNGSDWIVDPKASNNDDDGNGNTNSVALVLPNGFDRPAAKGDGAITASALFCDQKPAYLNYDRGHLQFGLRTRAGDIDRVSLVTAGNVYPMAEVSSDEFYTKYRAEIPWDRKQNIRYEF